MGELKLRGSVWWIRYYRNGLRHEESARTQKKEEAKRLLRLREGDIAKGLAITSKTGRMTFDEAAADVIADYKVNRKRSLNVAELRIKKHLTPFFGGRRMVSITTSEVRAYILKRQGDVIVVRKARGTEPEITKPVSVAEINRELTLLKRCFSLAVKEGKLVAKPHIPKLDERNTRTGFFEREQFEAVRAHLPAALRPIVEFAFITDWRVTSEILPLEWRRVDLRAAEA
jgi:hypothetical protein